MRGSCQVNRPRQFPSAISLAGFIPTFTGVLLLLVGGPILRQTAEWELIAGGSVLVVTFIVYLFWRAAGEKEGEL